MKKFRIAPRFSRKRSKKISRCSECPYCLKRYEVDTEDSYYFEWSGTVRVTLDWQLVCIFHNRKGRVLRVSAANPVDVKCPLLEVKKKK